MLTTAPLTEGDFVRGGPPDLERCMIVDPRSGAACTQPEGHRGDHAGTEHVTVHAPHGLSAGMVTSERPVRWSGGTDRAVVARPDRWVRVAGTDLEVRTQEARPAALLVRPVERRPGY